MGRRGPPPKPTRTKEAAGNPGHRPLNADEPHPKQGRPGMPGWLSREAKAEWRRVVPELARLGLLTLVDRAALAAYCQAHAELVQATKTLEAEGRVINEDVFNRNGEVSGSVLKLHPAVKLQRDAFGRVKQFLGEFGLTPASRTRLSVPQSEKPTDGDPDLHLFDGSALG